MGFAGDPGWLAAGAGRSAMFEGGGCASSNSLNESV
jgi:hypothetical protein